MLKDTPLQKMIAQSKNMLMKLTSGRLESKSYECRLLSVSDIIRENNIKKIDLLKIDAEKSELGIIKGIKDEDWDKIKQIVIEIHDKSRKVLEEIEKILTSKGFSIAVEEEKMLRNRDLFNVFARKNNSSNDSQFSSNNNKVISEKLTENTNNFVNALQSFNQKSSAPLILAITPRSPIVNSNPSTKNLYDKFEFELIEQNKKLFKCSYN